MTKSDASAIPFLMDRFPADVRDELSLFAKEDRAFKRAYDSLCSTARKLADEPVGVRNFSIANDVVEAVKKELHFRVPQTVADLKQQYWWAHVLFDAANEPVLDAAGKPFPHDDLFRVDDRSYDREARVNAAELLSNYRKVLYGPGTGPAAAPAFRDAADDPRPRR